MKPLEPLFLPGTMKKELRMRGCWLCIGSENDMMAIGTFIELASIGLKRVMMRSLPLHLQHLSVHSVRYFTAA